MANYLLHMWDKPLGTFMATISAWKLLMEQVTK